MVPSSFITAPMRITRQKMIQENVNTRSPPTNKNPKTSHIKLRITGSSTTFTLFSQLSPSPMKSSRKFASFSASSTTTVTYTLYNDHSAPRPTTEIPIQSPPTQPPSPTPIPVHLPQELESRAASKIQSAYKAHLIRTLYKKISSVDSEANRLQRLIQRQETVDSIRSNEREKLRMNEALMGLLLRLDSVPGVDPSIREARRKVSRRIVGLQEILDGICGSNVHDDDFGEWGPYAYWRDLDKVVEQMEEEICRERGGDEMDRFCAQHLGFRCLQRFLRE